MTEENKTKKTDEKKGKINKEKVSSNPRSEQVDKVSFDSYFRLLMNKNNNILPHHKAPMKDYVRRLGYSEATTEEFDKILKKY